MEDVFARRKEKMQVEGMNHAELAAASESATDADEDEVADDRSGSGSSSDCYSSSSQMGVEKVAKTPAKKRAVAKKTPKASASTVRSRMRFKSHGEKRDPSPAHSDATTPRVAKNEKIITAASDFCDELQRISSVAIWKGDFSSNCLDTKLKKTLTLMQALAAFIDKLSVDDPSELKDHAQQVHANLTQESERLFKVKDITATVKIKGVALRIVGGSFLQDFLMSFKILDHPTIICMAKYLGDRMLELSGESLLDFVRILPSSGVLTYGDIFEKASAELKNITLHDFLGLQVKLFHSWLATLRNVKSLADMKAVKPESQYQPQVLKSRVPKNQLVNNLTLESATPGFDNKTGYCTEVLVDLQCICLCKMILNSKEKPLSAEEIASCADMVAQSPSVRLALIIRSNNLLKSLGCSFSVPVSQCPFHLCKTLDSSSGLPLSSKN